MFFQAISIRSYVSLISESKCSASEGKFTSIKSHVLNDENDVSWCELIVNLTFELSEIRHIYLYDIIATPKHSLEARINEKSTSRLFSYSSLKTILVKIWPTINTEKCTSNRYTSVCLTFNKWTIKPN